MIQVRLMTADDAEWAAELEQKYFSAPWDAHDFVHDVENDYNIALVGEVDGERAGYVCLWQVVNEADIANIAVDEKFRRNGLARQLLMTVMEQAKAKTVDTFFLEVRESNVPAIALYESLGFVQIGTKKEIL